MAVAIIALLAVAVIVFESTQGDGINLFSGIVGNMNASDIAVYAQNAGFSGADLATAVAVALAESSGNPTAVGDLNITPGGSVGLWQINLKYHPDLAQQDLTDPQVNANAAYSVYQDAGNSFQPWSTFKTGAYMSYIDQVNQAVNA